MTKDKADTEDAEEISEDDKDFIDDLEDVNEDEYGLLTAESRAVEERFQKLGYHEAYDAAKEERLQDGFEAGYKETFEISKEIGVLLGRAVMGSKMAVKGDGNQTTPATNPLEQEQKIEELIRERLTAPHFETSDLQTLKKQINDVLHSRCLPNALLLTVVDKLD